ncbi:hypothetical protein LDL76_00800 [Salegentibacter mishustinae]|uniref:hypothetical protein n=1 Tax=Salegentibacter mishustinae TaxID=270918 RepID=UPI001CE03BA4|nr:hypothetical protein [Salegentibacter mishustinae]UBZ07265.1 hypothetical protein LDL76_00800 [Salegentibacter mishustinae]
MKVEVKIFKAENLSEKRQYANQVYKLLEVAYTDCEGIRLANGFNSPDDMINTIPVWRLTFKNSELISAMVFKEKTGSSKMVAYAPLSAIDPNIRKSDLLFMLNNSYAELSGKLLSITLKEIPSEWQNYVSDRPEVFLQKNLITLSDYLKTEILPSNSEGMYRKLEMDYPELIKYCYLRKIGDEFKMKILFKPGK